jgi:ABC-type transport system involved in multi-copper enzyme maturation permease subunit
MRTRIFFLLIKNTLIKEYRNKTLLLLLLFTLLILWAEHTSFDYIFNKFFKQNNINLVQYKIDLFYYIISSWNILMAAMLGVGCVRSDNNDQVLESLLSLPISRSNYIFSRVGGTWLIVMGYYVFSLLLAYFIFSFDKMEAMLGWPIISSLLMSSIPILGIITLSVFLSLHFSKIWAFMVTLLCSGLISHANEKFSGRFLDEVKNIQGVFDTITALFHSFVPHLGTFNTLSKELFSNHDLTKNLALELLHFGGSYGLLVFGIMITFRHLDH